MRLRPRPLLALLLALLPAHASLAEVTCSVPRAGASNWRYQARDACGERARALAMSFCVGFQKNEALDQVVWSCHKNMRCEGESRCAPAHERKRTLTGDLLREEGALGFADALTDAGNRCALYRERSTGLFCAYDLSEGTRLTPYGESAYEVKCSKNADEVAKSILALLGTAFCE